SLGLGAGTARAQGGAAFLCSITLFLLFRIRFTPHRGSTFSARSRFFSPFAYASAYGGALPSRSKVHRLQWVASRMETSIHERKGPVSITRCSSNGRAFCSATRRAK